MTWATGLAISPLVLGSTIFVGWYYTHAGWLALAGLAMVPFGFVSVISGGVLIWSAQKREDHAKEKPFSLIAPGMAWIALLLILNFAAAGYFIRTAIELSSRYTVQIHNDTVEPLEGLVIRGPGVNLEVPSVLPGKYTQHHLQFAGDGRLMLHFPGEIPAQHMIEGYVSSGLPGETSVRISGEGTVQVLHPDRRNASVSSH